MRDWPSPPKPATFPHRNAVRNISVATLAARFATWVPAAAERRARLADELLEALDPASPLRVREMLGHAAVLLDVGRAIDYYDRFEHAAMIVTAADLGGSRTPTSARSRRSCARPTTTRGSGRTVTSRGQGRPGAVLRAATALTLADELNRRIPRRPLADQLQLDARWIRDRRTGAQRLAPARCRAAVREGVWPASLGRGQRIRHDARPGSRPR